jgi:hypothetical protein
VRNSDIINKISFSQYDQISKLPNGWRYPLVDEITPLWRNQLQATETA